MNVLKWSHAVLAVSIIGGIIGISGGPYSADNFEPAALADSVWPVPVTYQGAPKAYAGAAAGAAGPEGPRATATPNDSSSPPSAQAIVSALVAYWKKEKQASIQADIAELQKTIQADVDEINEVAYDDHCHDIKPCGACLTRGGGYCAMNKFAAKHWAYQQDCESDEKEVCRLDLYQMDQSQIKIQELQSEPDAAEDRAKNLNFCVNRPEQYERYLLCGYEAEGERRGFSG